MYTPVFFQAAVSALELRVSEFLHEPFKSKVSFSYKTLALLDVSLTGFQSQMLWGFIFPEQLSWAGETDVGFGAVSPQGEPLKL